MSRRLAVLVLFTAIACAGGASLPESTPAPTSASSRGEADVITAEELADPLVATDDAYEAVKRLRPRFLHSRSASGRIGEATAVHLSVDYGKLQAVENLRNYRPSQLLEIRYFNGPDGAQRFGAVAGSGGVVLIRVRT